MLTFFNSITHALTLLSGNALQAVLRRNQGFHFCLYAYR